VLSVLLASALQAETALVLPFFNHSKQTNLDWIGESIAETVRDALASKACWCSIAWTASKAIAASLCARGRN